MKSYALQAESEDPPAPVELNAAEKHAARDPSQCGGDLAVTLSHADKYADAAHEYATEVVNEFLARHPAVDGDADAPAWRGSVRVSRVRYVLAERYAARHGYPLADDCGLTRGELDSLTVVSGGPYRGAAILSSAGYVSSHPDRDAAYAEVRRLRGK